MLKMEIVSLPPNYDYNWNENILNIKGLSDEDDVKVWVEELSKTSYVTWRVKRTFPYKKEKGKLYRFKKVYRCQHNTRPVNKNMKQSKHTGCPATLTITISRHEDKDGIIWARAVFEKNHNHLIKDPSLLRYRPISNETKAEIIKLFENGHTSSSAYCAYTSKKVEELGEIDYLASYDRSNFPSKKDFQNLWEMFNRNNGERQGKNMLKALEKYTLEFDENGYVVCVITSNTKNKKRKCKKSPDCINIEAIEGCINAVAIDGCINAEAVEGCINTEECMNTEAVEGCINTEVIEECMNTEVIEECITTEVIEECITTEAVDECINSEVINGCINAEAIEECINAEAIERCINAEATERCINTEATENAINDEAMDNVEETLSSVPDVIKSLEMMFHKLKEIVIKDPKNMVPPAKKLIENFERCSASSTDLASAMHTAFSDAYAKHLFNTTVPCEKEIPVQPMAVSRRTLVFSKKGKPNCAQPTDQPSIKYLKEQESGSIKQAQLHNLVVCVDKNTSVGNNI